MYPKYMFKWLMLMVPFAAVLVYQGCSGVLEGNQSQYAMEGFCSTPPGVSGSPQNIEDAVRLINALPKPVTIPCFLSSLSRPLEVSLTNATLSAQPAVGNSNPRIFIMYGKLFISVVPEGMGRDLVEFSVLNSSDTSIKGELHFPIKENIPLDLPYTSILTPSGTTCAACHSFEQRATEITFAEAYSSRAFQPRPETRVTLERFRNEYEVCKYVSSQRCQMIKAFFGFGEVREKAFPSQLPFGFSF